MERVEKWRWRIRWAGRWTATKIAYSEAEIRREHPEAVKIEETRVLVELPGAAAEVAAAHRPPRRHLDAAGEVKKMWEE